MHHKVCLVVSALCVDFKAGDDSPIQNVTKTSCGQRSSLLGDSDPFKSAQKLSLPADTGKLFEFS
jgi:hypothetical protein